MKTIKENVELEFSPNFVAESSKEGWLQIGGIALVEGVSKNKRKYSIKNINENDGKEFKYLLGHPKDPNSHVIGKGKFVRENDNLMHDGKIRNTAAHPDVVEQTRDGFLQPSIHAKASKIIQEEDGNYAIEGLDINGIGLVAFRGLKDASIEYAIAESFKETTELEESDVTDDNNKDKGENMAEDEIKKTEEPVVETPEAPKEEPVVETPETPNEQVSVEDFKQVQEELNSLKTAKKEEIIIKILEANKELKKEELMEMEDDKLNMILEYEEKLASNTTESAVVESNDAGKEKLDVVEQKDGSASLSESAYQNFNEEIRKRI